MKMEFEALQAKSTCILVEPLTLQYILGCQWLYKTIFNSNGSIA